MRETMALVSCREVDLAGNRVLAAGPALDRE